MSHPKEPKGRAGQVLLRAWKDAQYSIDLINDLVDGFGKFELGEDGILQLVQIEEDSD